MQKRSNFLEASGRAGSLYPPRPAPPRPAPHLASASHSASLLVLRSRLPIQRWRVTSMPSTNTGAAELALAAGSALPAPALGLATGAAALLLLAALAGAAAGLRRLALAAAWAARASASSSDAARTAGRFFLPTLFHSACEAACRGLGDARPPLHKRA